MAKIKNTGHQPRGFIGAGGEQVTIPPGGEAEVNMTEADFKNLQKIIEGHDDPKPFEISGSHEATEAKKEKKKEGEVEMPAQSTEPPPAPATPQVATPAVEKTREHQKEAPATRK
jgi:hypothetical protein